MALKEALAALRAENAALKSDLSILREPVERLTAALQAAHTRVNALEGKKTPPPSLCQSQYP